MKGRELYLPGSTNIDVGANIGNHAVFFGALLNAPVHAFEPFQPNYDLLEMKVAANGLEVQGASRLTGNGQRALAYCFGEQLYQPDLPVRLMSLQVVSACCAIGEDDGVGGAASRAAVEPRHYTGVVPRLLANGAEAAITP
ncbi:MAG TPA: hypothetical protein VHU42_19085 [Rhodopila sp.]|jgi:hypothetical protein|nr:hypothetical protein [Rhodopila sp.]